MGTKSLSRVKSKNTGIEIAFSKALHSCRIRYRRNTNEIFGSPDFTIKKYKIAIFIDGDFWHGKDWDLRRRDHKTNIDFWHRKIEQNIRRDKIVNQRLANCSWKVFRFWGSEVKEDAQKCAKQVVNFILDMKEKKEYLDSNENNSAIEEPVLTMDLYNKNDIPFPKPRNPSFTFIDLFAGIGGFRLAFQSLNGECVFSSEWDKKAQETYVANFGELPYGDITSPVVKSQIPKGFDILCGGFPCQAFSIAGRRNGFEDTRGTLFFDVAEIIKIHQPKAFFLENVKGLVNHDKGNTLKVILSVLREDLGYFVPDPKILNAKDYGVPQNRERIFIVGFHQDTGVKDFEYPMPYEVKTRFSDIKEIGVSPKYYLSDQYLKTLKEHKSRHVNKGNGFGYEVISDEGIANAVVCGGMGRERNLVYDENIVDFTPRTNIKGHINREFIRKMTPREWARLQGFPDSFVIPVADASAYKQFGNSVAVPAIKATADVIVKKLNFPQVC
jgi:DNA (cytosine-5)-methyltransferase 1